MVMPKNIGNPKYGYDDAWKEEKKKNIESENEKERKRILDFLEENLKICSNCKKFFLPTCSLECKKCPDCIEKCYKRINLICSDCKNKKIIDILCFFFKNLKR